VAFSRRDIFRLRREVEAATGLGCAVVYGSLPPKTRRAQAARFNNEESADASVLIASDAVGMGLNLKIRRLIFAALHKFDGEAVRPLSTTEVKQIAGRAGRGDVGGTVTCLHAPDQRRLREALDAPLRPLRRAGLSPTFEQLEGFEAAAARSGAAAKRVGGFAALLLAFADAVRTDRRFFCCTLEPQVRLAAVVDAAVPWGAEDAEGDVDGDGEGEGSLDLARRHTLSLAPLDAGDDLHADCLSGWARAAATGSEARLRYAPPERAPRTHEELQALESYFRYGRLLFHRGSARSADDGRALFTGRWTATCGSRTVCPPRLAARRRRCGTAPAAPA
jgi:ATP-dependent RNA helicase SUPV3L1/SUV3